MPGRDDLDDEEDVSTEGVVVADGYRFVTIAMKEPDTGVQKTVAGLLVCVDSDSDEVLVLFDDDMVKRLIVNLNKVAGETV